MASFRFGKTVACTGLPELPILPEPVQTCNFPFERVSAVNCQIYYKIGHTISESELEGRGLCSICKLLAPGGEDTNTVKVEVQCKKSTDLVEDFGSDGGHNLEDDSDNEKSTKTTNQRKHLVKKNELAHTCILCKARFARTKSLGDHMNRVHPGYEPFSCINCDKRFSLTRDLQIHNKSVHNDKEEQYQCPLCEYQCVQISSLKLHIKDHQVDVLFDHPVKCSQCTLTFSRKSQLDKHVKRKHTKEHACKHCSKTFLSAKELTQHAVIHTGKNCTFIFFEWLAL